MHPFSYLLITLEQACPTIMEGGNALDPLSDRLNLPQIIHRETVQLAAGLLLNAK